MNDLFRKEALQNQAEAQIGDVIVYTPIKQYVMLLAVLIPALVLSLFCYYGSYSRKERVAGTIVPDRGIINVISDRAGVLDRVNVGVSDDVFKNEPLLELKLETVLGDGSIVESLILDQLSSDLDVLRQELQLTQNKYLNSIRTYDIQQQSLEIEKKNITEQLNFQKLRVEIESKKNDKFARLIIDQVISDLELTTQQSLFIAEQQNLIRLEFEISKLESELKSITPKKESARILRDSERASLEKKISEIERQRIRSRSMDRTVVRSTVDGKVASLNVKRGQSINSNQSLMTILPKGASLVVELYVPSRASGFIATGQNVRLFYDAYPYQKFGASDGVIIEISETILPINTQGLTREIQEPYFNVVVELMQQKVDFEGQLFPLQSGMQLEADIILEERKIWEWILQPLLKAVR